MCRTWVFKSLTSAGLMNFQRNQKKYKLPQEQAGVSVTGITLANPVSWVNIRDTAGSTVERNVWKKSPVKRGGRMAT